VRSSLNVAAVSVTPQIAYANNLAVERGALVTKVEPDGPAAIAGLEPGDVITAVQGVAIRDLHDLHERLAPHRVGETLEVAVPRGAQVVLDAPVRFVNRTDRDIHVDLLGPEGEHHVVNVPGRIWAAFPRPGRHPFVVHVASTGREIGRGIVEVAQEARTGPPVCGWISVEGVCIEP